MSNLAVEKDQITEDGYRLKLYNQIIPLTLMSLGSLYIGILFYRYIRWRCRKRKAKHMRLHRQKLERAFMERVAFLDSKQRIQKPSHCYSDNKPLFDSNVTLVVDGAQQNIKQKYLRHSRKDDMSNSQQKKRRQLLWQWSVSMGYCRYSHGYHLDLMIDQLVKHSGKNNSDNIC